VKVSAIGLCGSLLPLSLVLDWGLGNGKRQAQALMAKASAATLPAKLYADAGYDVECGCLTRAGWTGVPKA